jgi:shikimate kinase
MLAESSIAALQNLNIYLIGMMGCGKSTIGRLLAKQAGYSFIDTDASIEKVAKQSIKDLFAAVGEENFRAIESQVLAEVAAYTRLVVATGGGIVLCQANWGSLRQGLVVWLDATPAVIWQRLAGDQSRPLLQGDNPQAKLREILAARRDRYAEADLRVQINTETDPQIIVNEILERIPEVLKSAVTHPEN